MKHDRVHERPKPPWKVIWPNGEGYEGPQGRRPSLSAPLAVLVMVLLDGWAVYRLRRDGASFPEYLTLAVLVVATVGVVVVHVRRIRQRALRQSDWTGRHDAARSDLENLTEVGRPFEPELPRDSDAPGADGRPGTTPGPVGLHRSPFDDPDD